MKKLFRYLVFLLLGTQALSANAQGLSVFGNYLYWNASEQTDTVWSNAIAIAPNQIVYTIPNVNFNWNSGFRGGISYELPHFWDTKLYWTHYTTSKNTSYAASGLTIFTPEFFSGFLSMDLFSSANLNWQIAMNTIDFAISHAVNLTNTLVFSPSIGIKGATINQTVNSTWNAALFSIPLFSSTEKVTNNYSGIGPSFGIDGKWNMYKGFSLVGNFSTALMWGHWNIKDTYSRPSALFGLITPTTITTSLNNGKLGTAVFQYFLGLEWTHHSKYDVNFLLGYEMQFWPNQLRAPTFQLLPLHGDLTLQGATCGISISL